LTYIIAEPCVDVKDLACVDVCPVDCIYGMDNEEDRMLYISPDECIDCAACEPVCPVTAIFTEEDTPAEWKTWIPINYDYFTNAEATRSKVNEMKPPA
jgi:ferredoxin